MKTSRLAALVALPAALVLAACSSSTSGKGHSGASSTSGKSGSSAGTSVSPAQLGAKMQAAVASIKYAHITLDVNAAGQALTGAGDEQLDNGRLVAMDLKESLPGGAGDIEIIIVDGKSYAKLPTSLNSTGKPYLLVTPNSSNAVIKQLAGSLDSALSSASLGSVSAFISAADSIKDMGHGSVNGVDATHYAIVVNVAKLPSTLPGKDALVSGGLTTLPLDLYIDSKNRPVQVTENFKVQGQSVATTVKVGSYDQPVTITAPPASQVGS